MNIRKATIEDAESLFTWRNDPVTRLNSIHTGEVAWEEHISWLKKTLQNSERELYVVEDDEGRSCGTIRLNHEPGDFFEVSWTVAPECRGKGIGKLMTQKFFKEYLRDKKGKVIARAKTGNAASLKMIESLGFVYKDEQDDLTSWIW